MRARPDYLPTPQQIASACARIRQSWSPDERRRRLVGFRRHSAVIPWQPPRIDTAICTARVRRAVAEISV